MRAKTLILCLVLIAAGVFAAAAQEAETERFIAQHEGLFPEGVAYDPVNDRFLVSSVAEGTVYAVNGDTTPFIEDDRIPSSFGLAVDAERNRLLVTANDLQKFAALGVYDLTSGEPLLFVDLGALTPLAPGHFANDVTVDSQGNAYVTDSMAGVIYRVDTGGNAAVWLQDDSFSTDFTLNGIAYHPAGEYLIAVRNPGLIKIPLANPADFTEVTFENPPASIDGIVLLDETMLDVVANEEGRVLRLTSEDEFASVSISGEFVTGMVFPTTLAVRDGDSYVLYSRLNEDHEPISEFPIQRVEIE